MKEWLALMQLAKSLGISKAQVKAEIEKANLRQQDSQK